MDVTAYHVRKIVAEPNHSVSSHWIDLKIFERTPTGQETESEIALFIDGFNAGYLVDSYAAAINSVNESSKSEAA